MKKVLMDKNRVPVKNGDKIKFSTSEKIYKLIEKDGDLGSYEDDGEFIRLKDCLRNFTVQR